MEVRRSLNGIKRLRRLTFLSFYRPMSLQNSSTHELTCHVKTDSSFWTREDGTMHVTLEKRDKGQTWSSPILGEGQLDPYSADLEQKRLMLRRFQEENQVLTSHRHSLLEILP